MCDEKLKAQRQFTGFLAARRSQASEPASPLKSGAVFDLPPYRGSCSPGLPALTTTALFFDHAALHVSLSEHGLPRSRLFGRRSFGSKRRRLPDRPVHRVPTDTPHKSGYWGGFTGRR
jgi:hypothetical protein